MIFLTGANGFLGKHLVSHLVANKQKIKCYLQGKNQLKDYDNNYINITNGNLIDKKRLFSAMEGSNIIIHAAGVIKPSIKTNKAWNDNIIITKNVVECSIQHKIDKLIFISTIDTQLELENSYAKSKREAENIVKNSKLNFTILRPSILYGKGDVNISYIINSIIKKPIVPIPGSGNFFWQPLYITDLIDCIIDLINNNNPKYINITGPSTISYVELIDIIIKSLNIRRIKVYIPMKIIVFLAKIFKVIHHNNIFESVVWASENKIIKDNRYLIRGSTDISRGINLLIANKHK